MTTDRRLGQAEINRRMWRWGDAEIARFTKRVALFRRRGLSESQAERVADRLALRDQERDERHLCIECANLTGGGNCAAAAGDYDADPLAPVRHPSKFIFQRCHGFAWAMPLPEEST